MATFGTIRDVANQLRLGYWRAGFDPFGLTKPHSFNMGLSGTGANSFTLIYDLDGWSFFERGFFEDSDGLTAGRRKFVDRVFQDLKSRFDIRSRRRLSTDSADSVDFWFRDDSPFSDKGKAFCRTNRHWSGNTAFSTDHAFVNEADINVDASWFGSSTTDNDYVYQTFYHEICHALGLGHPGNYNETAQFSRDNLFTNDSWQMSIMSYFDPTENSTLPCDKAFLITPGPADIEVLRTYYGANRAFLGNTVYGVNTNINTSTNFYLNRLSTFAARNAFTIHDDGGIDRLDFSNFTSDQRINLTVPSATGVNITGGNVTSDVGGLRHNMTLAVGTVIEDARTGSGNDSITGNGAANRFNGGRGADTYTLRGGADIVDFNFGASGTPSGSNAAMLDKITDLVWSVDKIDLLTPTGGALARPVALTRLPDNNTSMFTSTLATTMFTGLSANSARLCRATSSSLAGTSGARIFLAINNGASFYSTTDDLFIELTGVNSLPAVGSVTPSTLFI
jgi:hypothetical protein